MAVEWSGLGPELFVPLHRDSGQTLGSQLQVALRRAIRDGRLTTGEKLPSSRRFAADLGVSRGLVQATYEQLEAEGYLRAVAGSGTHVAFVRPQPPEPPVEQSKPARVDLDFSPGLPDLNSFPARDWLWAYGEATRGASAKDVDYGDAQGSLRLRQVAAAYLGRVRGTSVSPSNLVICGGFTQGLALTLAALRRAGVAVVAVEDPGHHDMARQVRAAGLEPTFVPVDSFGIDVDFLTTTSATAVIVTPAHQTPTGVVLAADRRHALLGWAHTVGGTIIEDDYDSEFRYDKQPVGALHGLGREHVVLIGSVSKSLAPALRLGWVAAPADLVTRIAEVKDGRDRGSPTLDQLALASLMESGRFDRHLRKMREVYSLRRHTLLQALHQHAPDVQVSGLDAGFHALATLPRGADEAQIVAEAADRHILLQGLQRYRSEPHPLLPGIVFGFGNINEGGIRRGVAAIHDLLRGSGDTLKPVAFPDRSS